MLQLNNLRLAENQAPVNLGFAAGQISVVLGRNDSGKTNLLRLIAGLRSSASAEVLLDGAPLPPLRSRTRPVAYVFQAFVNYPHWTVRQNIESPMRGKLAASGRLSKVQRGDRVAQIADTLQLEELLDRHPAELSGGQQQRLAIGRALASEARVLLLDEPFVNLDFRLRERLTEQLGELLRGTETAVLFASSDCRDAFSLADSLVLVAQQQVLQSGTPLVVYRKPVSIEAAHLMSEPAVNTRLDPHNTERLQGVRPEHMRLSPTDMDAEKALHFAVVVDAVETSGSHTYVQGALRGGGSSGSPEAARWVARIDGMRDFEAQLASNNSVLDFYVDPRNVLDMASA